MNIGKLKKIVKKNITSKNYYLTTNQIRKLLIEQTEKGNKTEINECFHLNIEGIYIALDFEELEHLILPF